MFIMSFCRINIFSLHWLLKLHKTTSMLIKKYFYRLFQCIYFLMSRYFSKTLKIKAVKNVGAYYTVTRKHRQQERQRLFLHIIHANDIFCSPNAEIWGCSQYCMNRLQTIWLTQQCVNCLIIIILWCLSRRTWL